MRCNASPYACGFPWHPLPGTRERLRCSRRQWGLSPRMGTWGYRSALGRFRHPGDPAREADAHQRSRSGRRADASPLAWAPTPPLWVTGASAREVAPAAPGVVVCPRRSRCWRAQCRGAAATAGPGDCRVRPRGPLLRSLADRAPCRAAGDGLRCAPASYACARLLLWQGIYLPGTRSHLSRARLAFCIRYILFYWPCGPVLPIGWD